MLSNFLISLTGYGENICYNKLLGINQAYYRRLIPKYRNIATIFKSNYNRNSLQKIILMPSLKAWLRRPIGLIKSGRNRKCFKERVP